MSDDIIISNSEKIVCYAPTMITTTGIWQGDNPLDYSLPLFIVQLTLVVVVTRLLVFILKPIRQPRVIAEILGGVILGPSVLGRSNKFAETIFPQRSVMVLETMANIGLLYFLFLVGVEMDIAVIRQNGKRSLIIAIAGMILPFVIGSSFSFLLHEKSQNTKEGTFILFLGLALSVTSFPVLARILAELKLINTEIGKLAMSASLINDMLAWVVLAFAIAFTENKDTSLASLWVILSSIAFICLCFFVVKPLIGRRIKQTPEGESISEFNVCLILSGVMIAGFITDVIGTHSVFGAFVFGLIIPSGPLGLTLIERLEDFVSGLLLPLFFAISGLKTEVSAIDGAKTWGVLFVVIILACAGKVIGVVLVSFFYQMPFYEGLSLGFLMNAKGLIEMIVLNVGKDQKVLDEKSFAIMVIVALGMTAVITPIVTMVYKPSKNFTPYKRRTVQKIKLDREFRVVVSIHTPRIVPTVISLLESSCPTKKSPICVYALHLVELTGRASGMLIVHNMRKSGRPAMNRTQAQSDHIINAFENFEKSTGCVYVQTLTAVSPYSTMHEDICVIAEEKRAALIIVPFHKQQAVDGGLEATNPAFRTINQNVLANAPCSVGILVDRGLSGSARSTMNQVSHHVAVLFFGGPDDREALAYAWRMSEHPNVNLTVMRFLPGETVIETERSDSTNSRNDHSILTVETERDREKQLDEEYVTHFRTKTGNDESIAYIERVVNHGEETVGAIRTIDNSHDLFIVGRGQGTISPLTSGLTDWSECPELGAIGDLLASSDFAMTASVLVVQQYVGMGSGDPLATPDSPSQHSEHVNIEQTNRTSHSSYTSQSSYREQLQQQQQPDFHSQH
ncbi:Cation/H(+) antiporter 15 [Capsicum baccatum]|uniref:Cation/H(+) antiporter 15 n=1 Tax=Capsicum baccatum TaxID=33114 RepID=A0A2G2XKU1_CAPBA|nr:Cation/H(+) antiporter 15 [Capsicum baccatum]